MDNPEWGITLLGNWRLSMGDPYDRKYILLNLGGGYVALNRGYRVANIERIPFPAGVTDVDELKAWALAIYRMGD